MIYKFLLLSDEVDNFSREIEINSDATFLELNNAILSSVNYQPDQLTSFFNCSNGWEKREEITLIEMDTNSENDSYIMENTRLNEFVMDEGDRLIFVFDVLTERSFFLELKDMQPGSLPQAKCTRAKGDAPKQITSEDDFLNNSMSINNDIIDGNDFYGDSEFDSDELDAEGYDNIGLDELSERY